MIEDDDNNDTGIRIRSILDAVLGGGFASAANDRPVPSSTHPISLSPEVYEYLVELLKDSSTNDNNDDPDALIDTVASFLEGEMVNDEGIDQDEGSSDHHAGPRDVASRIAHRVMSEASSTTTASQGAANATPATSTVMPIDGTSVVAPPPPLLKAVGNLGMAESANDDRRPVDRLDGGSYDKDAAEAARSLERDGGGVTKTRQRKDKKAKHPSTAAAAAASRSSVPVVGNAAADDTTGTSSVVPTQYLESSSVDESDNDSYDDDYTSAWKECQLEDGKWGGRGRGGRGEYAGAVNSVKSNVHLSRVTIALPSGEELLSDSVMDISLGHCYGLLGRNGVGKSTLLRRIANKSIPGIPSDMRILLVAQEMDDDDVDTNGSSAAASAPARSKSALETLVRSDRHRTRLLKEQEYLEKCLDDPDHGDNDDKLSPDDIVAMGERLGQVIDELEEMEADRAEDRAKDILVGLQFTPDMMNGPVSRLSGGWRMRLKLARALYLPSDLILFDECTNHLDLYGLEWLTSYLTSHRDKKTLMVVSHDRNFLDAICTDIVVLEHRRLTYHPGNYTEYERQMSEKAARESQILDAAERQRTKAVAFVQKQQQQQVASSKKKFVDPNKQRQAKMIRDKKLDRIGNYREDGKRYKTHSLQKLSEEYSRQAQKVVIEQDDPVIAMHFPNPTWAAGISTHDALIKMEDYAFGFDADRMLFENVTLNVTRQSKVCVVGRNGAGKSTLVNLFAGSLDATKFVSRGTLWVHPNVRIGHVTQYAVETLGRRFGSMTTVQYAEHVIFGSEGKASADAVAKAAGNVRQYLGAFGLGGRHALQKVDRLSGGERMRLCFATVLAEQPHILLLDESTNHVDITTLDSMSLSLRNFQGAVVMVSHNQGFLSGFCNELWVVDQRRVLVHPSDASSFDEIFSEYRTSIHSQQSGMRRATQRKEKAVRAKVATQQRAGARQAAALL